MGEGDQTGGDQTGLITGHERARALRRNMTDAERALWGNINRRQIEGFKFRRQHVLGPYIVDFVFLEQRLIVEIDSGQHAERLAQDEVRSRWLNT